MLKNSMLPKGEWQGRASKAALQPPSQFCPQQQAKQEWVSCNRWPNSCAPQDRMVYIRWSPPCSCESNRMESNIRKLATVNASKQIRKALQKENRKRNGVHRQIVGGLNQPHPFTTFPLNLGCPRSGKTRSSLEARHTRTHDTPSFTPPLYASVHASSRKPP